MRDFILDADPNLGETSVTLDDITYTLYLSSFNLCYLNISDKGIVRDSIAFTRQDLKAIFLLLSTNKKK